MRTVFNASITFMDSMNCLMAGNLDLRTEKTTLNSEHETSNDFRYGTTEKLPDEGFKRAWPSLIKMDDAVKAKVETLFKTTSL